MLQDAMGIAFRMENVAGLFSEGVESDAAPTPTRLRMERGRLFAETPWRRIRRVLRALLAAAAPRRLLATPAYLEILARDRAVGAAALPDPATALDRPRGYCGAAADLAPTTLIQAYAQGLHACAAIGPATWWAPPARRVRPVVPQRTDTPAAQFDLGCSEVIERASEAASRRFALHAATPALKHAHARLADRGFVHCWRTGETSGGYGVAVGRVFILLGVYAPDAAAARRSLSALEAELARRRFSLLDITFLRDAFGDLPALEMSRAEYNRMLDANPDGDRAPRWTGEAPARRLAA